MPWAPPRFGRHHCGSNQPHQFSAPPSLVCLPSPARLQVADWEQLRRRKEFDLLQAYPAAGLHPSTFVPTSQAVPALPDSAAAAVTAAAAAAAALPVPVPAMVPASGSVPLVPAMPAPAAMPAERQAGGGVRQVGKITKANKQKSGGRTFTSKYRGVHQTFPTRRWRRSSGAGGGSGHGCG